MEEERECPWCEEIFSRKESWFQGPHGRMKVIRCSKCERLISVRLEREPERIIKSELFEGGSQ
jgi:hypothetical protein